MSGSEDTDRLFKGVALGALAPSLVEQFGSLLPAKAHEELTHYQRDNEALSRVRIRRLVPESAVDKARDRLGKRVIGLLVKYGVVTR